MNELSGTEVSRRSMMRITVGVVGVAGATAFLQSFRPDAAVAAAGGSDDELYLTAMRQQGFTDLAGIRGEYVDEAKGFTLPLPEGEFLPAQSSIRDTDPKTFWEPGIGVAEANLTWQTATVDAAWTAHSSGDVVEASRLLDELEAGMATPSWKLFWDDDANVFGDAVRQARAGNFDPLSHLAAAG